MSVASVVSPKDRYFVDSNVLLYYVDPVDSAKRARASAWLDALWKAGAGCLSWQVLHEFYWNAVRKLRMDSTEAREMVEDLVLWKPVDTSRGLIRQAWQWSDQAQLPYWDALIVAASQRSGARYLLSEDFQAGRDFDETRVVNPFEGSPADYGLQGLRQASRQSSLVAGLR